MNSAGSSRPTVQVMNTGKEEANPEINILLLGETGVGKSTFINAFVNYLAFGNLQEAVRGELLSLIPTRFTVTTDDFEEKVIQFGDCQNEAQVDGESATQCAKSYVFSINDMKIRLIDTPGMCDTRGIEQDTKNFDQLLRYLGHFKDLHAICVLLKPNNARVTALFEYCIKQLLSRLEKSASNNMVFLFTNSRGTFYRPGDTLPALKKILGEIRSRPPFVSIPFDKNNVFCIDNEAFRFLLAVRNNIKFTETETKDFQNSWTTSATECSRMLMYITGGGIDSLKPHPVQNTVSVNEARRLIINLAKPMADMSEIIHQNLILLQRHQDQLRANQDDLVKLKSKLYIPRINLRMKELDQPVTVCTSANCQVVYQIEGTSCVDYRQRCHKPCYLTNVAKELIGDTNLTNCAAMDSKGNCKFCPCSYRQHMHIYYETETYDDRFEDVNVKTQIMTNEDIKLAAEKKIAELQQHSAEFKLEREFVLKLTAQFAHFLQKSAITPYNDAYQRYIEYLLANEEALGKDADRSKMAYLKEMLIRYEEEKRILDEGLLAAQSIDPSVECNVTSKSILDSVQKLYQLPNIGATIKKLCEAQQSGIAGEQRNTLEYVHSKPYTSPSLLEQTRKRLKKWNVFNL